MSKVLLTRPTFDGLETSKVLQTFNIESLCIPLLEIKKKIHNPILYSEYDIFLFTSKNGVRNFKINVKKLSMDKLIFAVGNETKNLLLDHGYKNIISTDGNLENLKKGIIKYLKKGLKILHPTSSIKNDLKKFFFKYKCKYFHLQCYSALKVNKNKSLFKKFMISKNDKIVTIYSSLTARSFINEVKKLDLVRYCKNKIFIVISANVKRELECLGLCKIEVAKKPIENEMINLVIKNYKG